MTRVLSLIALITLVGVVGCQKKGAARPDANPSVTDITPVAGSSTGYTTPSDIPAPSYTPGYTASVETTVTPTTVAGGSSYTVRRGDTFYSIARTHYGNGKDWQKIASANPGVDPTKLRVGQSIVIP